MDHRPPKHISSKGEAAHECQLVTRAKLKFACEHADLLRSLLQELSTEHESEGADFFVGMDKQGKQVTTLQALTTTPHNGDLLSPMHPSHSRGGPPSPALMPTTSMPVPHNAMASEGSCFSSPTHAVLLSTNGLAHQLHRGYTADEARMTVQQTSGSAVQRSSGLTFLTSSAVPSDPGSPSIQLQPHVFYQRDASSLRRLSNASDSSWETTREASGSTSKPSNNNRGSAGTVSDLETGRKVAWQALHPDSLGMSSWEALGMLAMLWDWFAVPWFLSFYSPEDDGWLYYMSYFSRCYWTLDIPLLFQTAYYTPDHRLEKRIRKAAWRYFRTWFSFDVFVVLVDWIFAIVGNPSNNRTTRNSDLLKALLGSFLILAVIRMIRHSGRFVMVQEKFQMVLWQHGINQNFLLTKIMTIVLLLVLFNHAISCLWYAIGNSLEPSNVDRAWLSYLNEESRDERPYVYFTGLHWSFTQFLPGSMEVFPRRLMERFFNVVVLVGGWLVILTSTAVLTSMMTQQRLRIEQRQQRRLQLQKYLHQENVEHSLAMGIRRQLKASAPSNATIHAKDVEDLAKLSKLLRRDLHVAVHGARVRANSFFNIIEAMDFGAFANVCSGAVTVTMHKPDEVVFERGGKGQAITFVNHGNLTYMCNHSSSRAVDANAMLTRGDWYGEPALWLEWTFMGSLTSFDSTELLTISASSLAARLRSYPEASLTAQEFCMSVARCYAAPVASRATRRWTDLHLAMDHADVIAGMPRDARIRIGDALLEKLMQHQQWGFVRRVFQESSMANLREEIGSGSCFVSWHGDELYRTVFVVALRLRRSSDSALLVKLGEVLDGKVAKAAAQLPGTKRKEQEEALDAAQRCLSQDFGELAHQTILRAEGAEMSAQTQESGTYGLRSRYIKTTFSGTVERSEDLPTIPVLGINLYMGVRRTIRGMASLRSGQDNGFTSEDGGYPEKRRKSCCPRRPGVGGVASVASSISSTASGNKEKANRMLSASEQPILDTLMNASEVVAFPSKRGGQEMFMWVTDSEFEILQRPKAQRLVSMFLKELLSDEIKDRTTTTTSLSAPDSISANISSGVLALPSDPPARLVSTPADEVFV